MIDIATARVASGERRPVFTFLNTSVRPSDKVVVIAFDDHYSLGVLHSELHHVWFEARCVRLKADLNYNSKTVWDSFPWPQAPTAPQIALVEDVVRQLLEVRATNLAAGMSLAEQYDTLRQPGKSRLRDLHQQLDRAVVATYGFSTSDDYLAQLLALNLDIAADPHQARGPGPNPLPAPELRADP